MSSTRKMVPILQKKNGQNTHNLASVSDPQKIIASIFLTTMSILSIMKLTFDTSGISYAQLCLLHENLTHSPPTHDQIDMLIAKEFQQTKLNSDFLPNIKNYIFYFCLAQAYNFLYSKSTPEKKLTASFLLLTQLDITPTEHVKELINELLYHIKNLRTYVPATLKINHDYHQLIIEKINHCLEQMPSEKTHTQKSSTPTEDKKDDEKLSLIDENNIASTPTWQIKNQSISTVKVAQSTSIFTTPLETEEDLDFCMVDAERNGKDENNLDFNQEEWHLVFK